MAKESENSDSVAQATETPAPEVDNINLSLKRDESRTAFDSDRHGRARMHFTNLGDVKGSDAFQRYQRSWLAPFFGSNEPEEFASSGVKVHPCKLFAKEVHRCLEANNNEFLLCQTRVANFQQCLREFNM